MKVRVIPGAEYQPTSLKVYVFMEDDLIVRTLPEVGAFVDYAGGDVILEAYIARESDGRHHPAPSPLKVNMFEYLNYQPRNGWNRWRRCAYISRRISLLSLNIHLPSLPCFDLFKRYYTIQDILCQTRKSLRSDPPRIIVKATLIIRYQVILSSLSPTADVRSPETWI